MKGWWCVRIGDALAWVEAPSETAALRRSLDLHPLGDWTDDASELVVFPQNSYPDNTGRHDYTRAVFRAGPSRRRRSQARPRRLASSLASIFVAGFLAFRGRASASVMPAMFANVGMS